MFAINLGGEGEIPDVLNQQGSWVVTNSHWRSSREGKTFGELIAEGHNFLICSNLHLPLPDESVDVVYTNGVPVDRISILGPGVQSSEVQRILKRGGEWRIDEGAGLWIKPQ